MQQVPDPSVEDGVAVGKLPAAQRQRIQMVLMRESGMTQPAIAEAMGVSLSTVNRAHMAYDTRRGQGAQTKSERRTPAREHGGDEEKALLARSPRPPGPGSC